MPILSSADRAAGRRVVPSLAPDDDGAAEVEKFRGYIREAGRDPAEVGIETWLDVQE